MATSVINNQHGLKNVLIVRFLAITDVVLTIPVVYSACRCYPDVNFYLVTRKSMTSMFINAPKNLKLVGVDIKSEYKGMGGAYRLIKELRHDYAIDAVVDLQNDAFSRIMRFESRWHRIPTACVNDYQKNSHPLIRRNNKVMLPLTSMIAHYRETFFRIGLPIQEQFSGLYGEKKTNPEIFAEI